MLKSLGILFLLSITLSSCNEENEEPRAVNFAVFFETICAETFSRLCVSEDEFNRIKKIFDDNENGADLDCLPGTVTDLEGTIHVGFLRGFSSTGPDIPCVQEEEII